MPAACRGEAVAPIRADHTDLRWVRVSAVETPARTPFAPARAVRSALGNSLRDLGYLARLRRRVPPLALYSLPKRIQVLGDGSSAWSAMMLGS